MKKYRRSRQRVVLKNFTHGGVLFLVRKLRVGGLPFNKKGLHLGSYPLIATETCSIAAVFYLR